MQYRTRVNNDNDDGNNSYRKFTTNSIFNLIMICAKTPSLHYSYNTQNEKNTFEGYNIIYIAK